jgi:hypothetical protein
VSRNYERLKPRPRAENAVILTKKSVAESQLEMAISLWFQNADPVPILVLAFNAHEILHALGKRIGKPSKLKTWLGTMPKPFQRQWEYVWNFCKHGLKDVDDHVPHDPRHADFLINFAVQCYRDVCGKRTALLFAFDLRFLIEHPECVNWSAATNSVRVPELVDAYREAASESRQEFLRTYLPLIQSGRVRI